jgi:hypothetical protein
VNADLVPMPSQLAALHAPNLGEALKKLARYKRLVCRCWSSTGRSRHRKASLGAASRARHACANEYAQMKGVPSMRIVVTSASGANGNGRGPSSRLNPGGGVISPDGRYCVTARTLRTIVAFSADLSGIEVTLLPDDVVAFPRGFAFSSDGGLFLAAGATGSSGVVAGVIFAISPAPERRKTRLVEDAELSPLDLTPAPNGNIVTSSEIPFGSQNAVTSAREYDACTGKLVRVFRPDGSVRFQRPRGLRFAPDGRLFCVTRDEVVTFDFESTKMLGAVVRFDGLHGQALEFFPP